MFKNTLCARTGIAFVALVAASTGSAAGFNFTFDNDAQGWRKGDFGSDFASIDTGSIGPAEHAANSGNGYLLGSDHSGYAFHFSPDLGGGHGALFGNVLEYRFRSAGGGGLNPQIVLMSSNAFLVRQRAIPASGSFISYSHTLDSGEPWYFNSSPYHQGGAAVLATDAQIQSVLNDLRHVGISTDIANGGDTTWTDNVRAVPEPASLAGLGLGALAFLRRRR